MHRAFSFPGAPERSRHKERLEASLAGLCELELLRQRQESLVLGALALGDPPCTPGHAARADPQAARCALQPAPRAPDALSLRRQLNSLQSNPWGLMAALEQQVGELRVDAEAASVDSPGEVGDSRPSSGFYELSEGQSSAGLSDSQAFAELPSHGCSRAQATYPCERPKSVGDAFVSNREALLDSGPRSMVPRSFSAPYPSLEGITEGPGEEESWPWDPSYSEGEPTAEDYKQARRIETYILGLIQRRALSQRPCKPRTSLCPDSRGVVRQSSLCRKETPFIPDVRNVSPCLEGQPWTCHTVDEQHYGSTTLPPENHRPVLYARQRPMTLSGARSASLDYPCGAPDPSSSEPESPQHFPSYPAPDSPPSYDQLVSAQYIPAQPCRTPTRAPTQRTSAAPKASRSGYSPERPPPRARATPKKCRFSEDRPASRKPGRRACRSQSENSLLGQRGVPERKYNTVERDSGRGSQAKAKRPQPGSTGYRRWRSTLELSQDEGEHPGDQAPRRSRKARPPALPYPYSLGPSHVHHPAEYLDHTLLCRPDEGYAQPIPGESESSLSEADSPGSTSLSSDSDESGGLVWPQQLPPQLAPASPPAPPGAPAQPKAFVKIKASHALKKKILRFRTGSLKVMTTV
ncbi:dapper homolog 1 [Scleropages formosus]|uniref:Dapper homolog 1-like n=1 Tax=Scleropages formosus TaxID=113540 RepID=A0A8C9SKV0_SCLFO|nr:dapper homolog 1-like [Scleropages formosus]